jgi:hypothetical protein
MSWTEAEWTAAGAIVASILRAVVYLLDRRDQRRHAEAMRRLSDEPDSH